MRWTFNQSQIKVCDLAVERTLEGLEAKIMHVHMYKSRGEYLSVQASGYKTSSVHVPP